MDWKMIGLAFAVVCALFLVSNKVDFVSAYNTSQSWVTVNGVVDVTINCTAVNFSYLAPGAVNQSAASCYPMNVSINANTNTPTTIAVNGSDLDSAGTALTARNITYTNGTSAPADTTYKTELNATSTSGSDNAGEPFDDWVNIVAGGATRYAYWWITVPAAQTKGTYTGTIYVKVSDTG
ncbi:MAG: hypothetical protein V1881_02685 [Candidatus Micrarchaeota archaeon]